MLGFSYGSLFTLLHKGDLLFSVSAANVNYLIDKDCIRPLLLLRYCRQGTGTQMYNLLKPTPCKERPGSAEVADRSPWAGPCTTGSFIGLAAAPL